jgi:succinate dehydrogenase/fumarate reductase flavoprotein subunit
LNHAVSFLYFDRLGVDPFGTLWPIHLLLEGHTRGVGGVEVDDRCATGVPGLFAAGDLTDRLRLVGANMSGGGPAVAWCFASGQWAGEAAAEYALGQGRHSHSLQGLGTVGLRPARAAHQDSIALVREGARGEVLPLDKQLFRTGNGIRHSLVTLDGLWQQARESLGPGDDGNAIASREAASILAGARWLQASALHRTETRGLHRRADFPTQNADGLYVQRLTGLDSLEPHRAPIAWAA